MISISTFNSKIVVKYLMLEAEILDSGMSVRREGHYDCGGNGDEQNCAYVVIGENELCGDEGKLDIDENDCQKAAAERGSGYHVDTSSNHPKGCLQIDNTFFNISSSVS